MVRNRAWKQKPPRTGRSGGVIRPNLPASVGSLSLSLDYFSIKVKNGVSNLSARTLLNRCYSDTSFDPNAGFCQFVERDADQALTVYSRYINLATDIVKGFEFNGRYARDLLGWPIRS